MQTIKVKWTGIRPLIMHNGLLADPVNPISRSIKSIISKGSRKMTDSDYESRDRLEWQGSLYWNEKLGLIIPSDNIERTIQIGTQKSRLGKDVAAAVFCSESEIPLQYDGPKNLEKLYADPRFQIRKGVTIQKSRLIRVRPMIPTGWSLVFTLEFDDTIINRKSLLKAMDDAGSFVGLGDWRPKLGRFISEE